MAQEQKLELKLFQKLILTPQLQQSIKLLQLPLIELSQNITQELMENPMLEEIVESEVDEKGASEGLFSEEDALPAQADDMEEPLEKIFGFTSDNYFEERGSDGRDLGYFNDGTDLFSPFERNVRSPNLYEHLLWQLRLSHASEKTCRIAEILINNLNEDGYLLTPIEEMTDLAKFDRRDVEEALSSIRDFDPPGVGAGDLRECLLLQLKPLNLEGTLVEHILKDGFPLLEQKKLKELAIMFKVSSDDILHAVNIIKGLQPRPGRSCLNEEAVHITPDVYVEEVDGKFVILLNDEGVPRVRLSNYYRKLLGNKKDLKSDEKDFLEEKLRSAIWLLKSLDHRNKTIYKVTESILKFQEDFFRKGFEYLKPLNLREVAADLEMHESTISRVTSNKYIQCPQGLLGYRFFFSNMVSSSNGNISSTIVKNIIKKIIAGEDPEKPYSDRKIVELLDDKSINITRRTVAKYRDGLKILPHFKRKGWS